MFLLLCLPKQSADSFKTTGFGKVTDVFIVYSANCLLKVHETKQI